MRGRVGRPYVCGTALLLRTLVPLVFVPENSGCSGERKSLLRGNEYAVKLLVSYNHYQETVRGWTTSTMRAPQTPSDVLLLYPSMAKC